MKRNTRASNHKEQRTVGTIEFYSGSGGVDAKRKAYYVEI